MVKTQTVKKVPNGKWKEAYDGDYITGTRNKDVKKSYDGEPLVQERNSSKKQDKQ